MSLLLSLSGVTLPGIMASFSGDIEAGSACAIVTSNEEESMALTRFITGIPGGAAGALKVEGRDIFGLTREELDRHRRRTGVVPPRGGLVSNLKLWENITLPLLYHSGTVSAEAEQTAQRWLAHLGYTGRFMTLPALLTPHERRIAVWVRMLLSEPDLVIFNNCFDDMPAASLPLFLKTAEDFHTASNRRTSLYLTSNPDLATMLPVIRSFTTAVPSHSTTITRDQ